MVSFVVYLLIPTSNHNAGAGVLGSLVVVYLLIPTSNHNLLLLRNNATSVVYLLIPTSNHNPAVTLAKAHGLYIF